MKKYDIISKEKHNVSSRDFLSEPLSTLRTQTKMTFECCLWDCILFEAAFSDVFLFKLTFRSPVPGASSEQYRISCSQKYKMKLVRKNTGNQEHTLMT